jgi:hypothetical protein
MNHTTKRSLRLSLLLLVGAALYLGGCGPENLDDPSYLAQLSEAEMVDSAKNEEEGEAPKHMHGKHAMGHHPMRGGREMNNQPMAYRRPGQPEMVAPAEVAVAGGPVIDLPPQFVRVPSEVVAQPPVITNTGEQINYRQPVLFEKEIREIQPNVNLHHVQKNLLIDKKYHTTVIRQPIASEVVTFGSDVAETDAVLPTTVVDAPLAFGGTAFGYAGFGPGCRPWLSGGFWRYCGAGPYGGPIPGNVVGPYFR